MVISEVAIILVGGFVAVAVILTIAFSIGIIIRSTRSGSSKRSGGSEADETRLIQEIHQGLVKMESRIESLETLLLDSERSKRSRFDRELSED